MSENIRYWIWLQRALGEGANIRELIEEFGSAKNIYDSNILEWRMSPNLTSKQINRLEDTKIICADEIIYNCQNNNWKIIDYEDSQYPERLKSLINPPAVLYVDGILPDIDNLALIGVVGTRKASDYSIRVTHIMSRGICDAGGIVVSGGALGVDTAAHKGAIMAGGKTIAVLGCGLGTGYLNQNKSLRDTIKHNGALITEYPPFTPASKFTFPLRNRIISGLSVGVLVVEAGVKSGSLITASYALEQGRDVFTVPASVLSLDFAGTNKLIEDGAMIATKPESIICQYTQRFDTLDISKIKSLDEYMNGYGIKSANAPEVIEPEFDASSLDREKRLDLEKQANSLTGDLKLVYNALENEFTQIDLIMEKTDIKPNQVISALTQLEIMGLAQSTSGKRYKKQ